MKSNSCIYLIPLNPVFNAEEVPLFESFDKQHSSMLYSALYLNHKENFDKLENDYTVVYCLDNKDIHSVPDTLNAENINLFFNDTSEPRAFFKALSVKHFHKFTNNIIVYYNCSGLGAFEINKTYNLISIEDEAVVIGKTADQLVAIIGFNSYNEEIYRDLLTGNINFDSFLPRVCKSDNFVYIQNNYFVVNNLSGFRKLYTELSKRESINYCSHKMHEMFTHLFIEYKDLLK